MGKIIMMEVLLKIRIQHALAIARVSKLYPAYYLFLESITGTQPHPLIYVLLSMAAFMVQ